MTPRSRTRPRFVLLAALCIALAVLPATLAAADEGDRVQLRTPLFVGQQTTLILGVVTDAGASVELDAAAPSWNGVEVISLGKASETSSGARVIHHMEVVVAGFRTGERVFAPAVNIVTGTEISPRLLPSSKLTVSSSLPPDAKLELTPLPGPSAIEGAESPLLKPAIGLGGLMAVALAGLAVYGLSGWVRRRLTRPAAVVTAPGWSASVPVSEEEIDRDPVAAYRTLATTVRGALARRYGLPAQALTTSELRRRMDEGGIDRFQGKLAGNLLEECDAVVYAGYRPAAERRHADLTMARELVEESA